MNFIKKLWKDLPQYGIMIVKCDNIAKSIGSGSMQYSFSKKEISRGVELCSVSAEGFKSACVTINFVMPLCDDASLYALMNV